jgi:hypothetical protein
MSDSIFRKRLSLWFAGFVVLALFGGGVLGLAFLGVERSGEATGDLRVSNDDGLTHRVGIEAIPMNGSEETVTVERAVTLQPNESVSLDAGTEAGEPYRLAVTIDDREPEPFEITGPDDHCTI